MVALQNLTNVLYQTKNNNFFLNSIILNTFIIAMEALPPVTETSDQLLLLSLYFGQFIRTLSEIRHNIATTYVYTNIHIIMHWIQIP